jgi:hypothetical protein
MYSYFSYIDSFVLGHIGMVKDSLCVDLNQVNYHISLMKDLSY